MAKNNFSVVCDITLFRTLVVGYRASHIDEQKTKTIEKFSPTFTNTQFVVNSVIFSKQSVKKGSSLYTTMLHFCLPLLYFS